MMMVDVTPFEFFIQNILQTTINYCDTDVVMCSTVVVAA